MNCKNCGQAAPSRYCSYCGQKTNPGRLDVKYLIREVSENVFQLQHGFFFTVKKLFTAPGKSIHAYLNGQRKPYFKPISYLFLLSTVYFLITLALDQNTWMGDFISGWLRGIEEDGGKAQPYVIWLSEKYAYTTLLLIPIFSLASYLSFFKYKKTYVEHIVINAYITGHQAIIYTTFALGVYFFEFQLLEMLPFLLSISYNIWVFYQLFDTGGRVLNILRSVLTYVLYLLFSASIFILFFLLSKL
jgi:hypothetical protein